MKGNKNIMTQEDKKSEYIAKNVLLEWANRQKSFEQGYETDEGEHAYKAAINDLINYINSINMEREDIKEYLKNNLRMDWEYWGHHYHIVLKVEGEKICDLDFGEGY